MKFDKNLDENVSVLKEKLKNNGMIVFRDIRNSYAPEIRATIIFADGIAGATLLNDFVVKPFITSDTLKDSKDKLSFVMESVVFSNDVVKSSDYEQCINALFSGDALFLIDGYDEILLVNARFPFTRSVSESENEKSLKGPRDSFGELILQNTALLMRRIKNPDFKIERLIIGENTKTTVLMCYIEGICENEMVEKVRNRISKIKTDSLFDTNQISELIKGKTYTPFKTSGSTERPDIAANKLLEGRIVIMTDGSPQAITVPFLFNEYFQSNDDYTINFYFASIARLVRYISFYISVYLPALYICAIKFQKTILPESLLQSLSSERAGAAFSVTAEVLIFLIFFEIIREAATRTPSAIGQTMSIVGGLILSETAASANIVSTPSIIVIAIAGITSVILPQMTGATTLLRICFVLLASFLGIYGLTIGTIILAIHLCSIDILEIAYVNSTIPLNRYSMFDTIIRAPYKYLERKKRYMRKKF